MLQFEAETIRNEIPDEQRLGDALHETPPAVSQTENDPLPAVTTGLRGENCIVSKLRDWITPNEEFHHVPDWEH